MTTKENATIRDSVNVTKEYTSQQPVDVVIALDASHSVSDDSWAAENQAAANC